MPTPVGHSLAGISIYLLLAKKLLAKKGQLTRFNKWLAILFCILLSNLPDIDLLNLSTSGPIFSWENHHGPTHSIAMAIVTAMLVGGVVRMRGGQSLNWFKITFWCVSLHSFLDYFGVNRGVMLLYPFSEQYFSSPVRVFYGVFEGDIFSVKTAMSILCEVGLIGLIPVGIIIYRRRFNKP